ncbi:MAG TPA: biotin--[acetyl-CoA-carboxylase] ligase [Stellaceae bacterium]|jgi:BirA family biotin operon repressor/biotin-[acetyl-CoA-carboxylase] ligase|nr:biotin--[acetyl-CoA-carboxylase] ligase [Stellaceae bacterium]
MKDGALALPDGFYLHSFDVIGSTSDEAKAMARAGAPQGTLVWARLQTSGRGRRGRAWVSPPGNLYCSLVWRPGGAPAKAAQLSFVTALAMADALAPLLGPATELRYKWPNDLLANGRKLSGILLESETTVNDSVDFVVIGIGVNLASTPASGEVEYPPTSIVAEGGAAPAPEVPLAAFARSFDEWARRWREHGFAPVRTAWLARARGLGEPIRVRLERHTLTGRFVDLDEDGALVLGTEQGNRRITAGEVFPATCPAL